MIKNKKKYLIKYVLPISVLLLIIDLSFSTIVGKNTLHLLLCFYIIVLHRQSKLSKLILVGLILSLESFVYYDTTIPFLSYIIPLSLIYIRTKRTFQKTAILPYLFLLLYMLIGQLLVEPYILTIAPVKGYTFEQICANLLMLVIFLKFWPKGSLGSRL